MSINRDGGAANGPTVAIDARSTETTISDVSENDMKSPLEHLKEKSRLRKQLLARSLGASAESLPSLLAGQTQPNSTTASWSVSSATAIRQSPSSQQHQRRPTQTSSDASSDDLVLSPTRSSGGALAATHKNTKLSAPSGKSSTPIFTLGGADDAFVVAKQAEVDAQSNASSTRRSTGNDSNDEKVVIDDYYKVLEEEEKVYRGSSTFLKGTQSANPHNDYSQNYIDSGQLPANFIRDPSAAERFAEYPKLKELIQLKDQLVADTATPPMYLQADLRTIDLRTLGTRFDVIIIEPPLPEYNLPGCGAGESWTWDQIEKLDIASVADTRSFVWIWCGHSPQGTNRGRQCLKRWGYRRCEDICWVKQNIKSIGQQKRFQLEPGALFHRVKEHCLMGIKGTVRRSVDGDFIHANVDIDLIIEEQASQPHIKPTEIFSLAERFCLGRRRLHLFARDDTLRPGWLSVGPSLTSSNFDRRSYRAYFDKAPGLTTGCTERVQLLRPKSPERGLTKSLNTGGGLGSSSNLATGSNAISNRGGNKPSLHPHRSGSAGASSRQGPGGSGSNFRRTNTDRGGNNTSSSSASRLSRGSPRGGTLNRQGDSSQKSSSQPDHRRSGGSSQHRHNSSQFGSNNSSSRRPQPSHSKSSQQQQQRSFIQRTKQRAIWRSNHRSTTTTTANQHRAAGAVNNRRSFGGKSNLTNGHRHRSEHASNQSHRRTQSTANQRSSRPSSSSTSRTRK